MAAVSTDVIVTVSDLRQYAYCERVVFYAYCQHMHRPTTVKMEEGARAHTRAEALEPRRRGSAYGLPLAERRLSVELESSTLGLRGRLDLLLVTPDEVIPVEFKQTGGRISANHRLQLAAYGLLAEEHSGRPAHRGFVTPLPNGRPTEIVLGPPLRSQVSEAVAGIRAMIAAERMPPPAVVRARCQECEYRRFCNDVN